MKCVYSRALFIAIGLFWSTSAYGMKFLKHNVLKKSDVSHRIFLNLQAKKEVETVSNLLNELKQEKKKRNPNIDVMKRLKDKVEEQLEKPDCSNAILEDAKVYREYQKSTWFAVVAVTCMVAGPGAFVIPFWHHVRYKALPDDSGILAAEIKTEVQRDFARASKRQKNHVGVLIKEHDENDNNK